MKVQSRLSKARDSRFTPGAGISPPVLAGRETEKRKIRSALDDLEAGLNPTTHLALTGPRRNGKTVLLRWARTEILDRYNEIKCIELKSESFESYQDLVSELADPSAFPNHADGRLSAITNLLESGISASREGAAKILLGPVLKQRCSENGFVILIDDAHTLDRYANTAKAFLNDVQALIGDARPLLLILAGSQNIPARLNRIEPTFWACLDCIDIGLLDNAAAREILRLPLKGMGYGIKARTIDSVVNEAQCYPYFLQVIGQALHRAAVHEPDKPGSGKEIGDAILERALKEFKVVTNNYYGERYQELQRAGVLPVAEAVARRFVSRGTRSISAGAYEAVVSRSIDTKLEMLAKKRGGIDPAAWVEDELLDLGFVWSLFGHEVSCAAGIPGLMNYIVERADECESVLRRT